MRTSEKKRQLLDAGCYKVREGSNHEIWYSPITKKRFPLPRHGAQELPSGTARMIDKQAGLK